MSLAQEDRAAGWQRQYGKLTGDVAVLAARVRERDARIGELEARIAAHTCAGLAAASRRQRVAAERDVPAARELLRLPDLTETQRAIAYQRWQNPGWTWAQVGASLGITRDQAATTFRRLAGREGLL